MKVLIFNGSPRPKGNGQCVQKDDMQFVYHELREAEMLVIASPIYISRPFWTAEMYH